MDNQSLERGSRFGRGFGMLLILADIVNPVNIG